MKRLLATIALLCLLFPCFGQSSLSDPGIAVEPQSQTAPAGSSVTLTVTASGTAPFDYQWWDSNGAIADATNAVFTLNPAETNESDIYFVVVSNAAGSITSSVANVTIGLPPVISVQPTSQAAAAGSSLSLSVTATGSAPLNYQWWDSTGAIADATNAVFTLDPAETNESDNYTVAITNAFGSITSSVANVSIGLPPAISVQPTSQAAAVGSPLSLSVTATGSAPLNYQWWDSTGAIADATNAVFTLNPAETNESDDYTVTVTNAFGSITSSVANVTIGLPPMISVQPMGQAAVVGSSLTLSVTATGSAPLNYQWWDSTGAIADATNAVFTLNPAETNESDNYTVIIENAFGSITSSVANVTIGLPPVISVQPMGQAAAVGSSLSLSVTATGSAPLNYQWWDSTGAIADATNAVFTLNPAETNESDNYTVIIENAFGSITSSVANVTIGLPPMISVQPMGQAAAAGSSLSLSVMATGSAPLNYQWWDSTGAIADATNAVFTLNPAETNESDNYTVIIENAFGSITSSVANVTIGLPPMISVQPMGQAAAAGSSLSLSVTATGSAPLNYQWWDSTGAIADATNAVFTLNPAETNESDNYTVIIENAFGSITSSVANVTIGLPPAISVQPTGQAAVAGSSLSLNVMATGSAPLNYQWWDSTGAIADATNAVFTLNPAETNESDNYTVIIENAFGSVTSSVANVTIGLPPVISVQPTGQAAAVGSSLSLSVTATGSAPLNYQWWDSTGAIADATNAVFTLNPAETNESDNYTVIIENAFGSITSSVANVTIGLPPAISVQPTGQAAAVGSSLSLSVTATGSAPLNYQWWDSTGAIADATNAVFTLNPAETNESDNYTVIVENAFGSVTSSVANVTIGLPPVISVQPTGQAAVAGSSLSLNVMATGSAPLTYQWWDSTGAIADATNAVFTLNPAETNESDNYTVIIENAFGSVTSSVANVTIGLPPMISVQPTGQNAPAGSSLTLSVMATGSAPLNYQWWDSTGAIADATNAVFTLNPAETNESGDYTVTVTNAFGSITSSVANVTIGLPPAISVQPMGQAVAAGETVVLSVTANGTDPLSYQWQLNGTNLNDLITTVAGNGIPGYNGDDIAATNASLNIPSGLALDALGDLYIADTGNQRVRKVDINNLISTVAGNGVWGYSGDGGAATNASFLFPLDVAIGPSGQLLVADQDNHRIREVDINGIITTVVGDGVLGNSGDGGAATNASLSFPHGLAIDSAGNLFIADSGSGFIRRVDTNGIITTTAGNGGQGYSGDGGAATNASLNDPTGVAVDGSGNLFIADSGNNCIRKVDTHGIITTVAGNGLQGYAGDGGAATNAWLNDPTGVAVDTLGNVFIADSYNSLVRQVDSAGIISTIAGNYLLNQYNFVGGYSGDGGSATNASLFYPYRVVLDKSGDLFIADLDNNRIRQVVLTTEPAITIHNLNTNNEGNYTVIVSDAFGSITSSVANVTNGLPPAILVQPTSQAAAVGSSLTLSVTATGSAPLNYQWWDSTGAIPDATNAVFTLDPVEPDDWDNYTVTINNAFGSVTSSVASVTNGVAPTILVQPAGQAVPVGSPLTLSVTATGSAPLNYQWWDSTGAIPDATNAVYTLDSAETNEADNYTVTIDNAFGSVTSSVASVTIGLPPAISVQPTSQAAAVGSSLTLNVTATGSAPLNYQWWDSAGAIADATNAVLTLDPAETNEANDYTVTIDNAFGSVTSSVANVTIDLPPAVSIQPMGQMAVEGSNATFYAVATGDDLHYQWYGYGGNDTNLVDGATNASLTVKTDGEGSQVYNISVVVTNLAGEVTSSSASLTVLTVLTGPINPYAPGTLGYDLFQSTFTLASSTNRTASYDPPDADLGTNSTVWTWPVNLSCVGHASDYYQVVLIASNELLTCAHDDGESGQTVTFRDTNGVSWVGLVTNVINVLSDLDISQLSNSAPSSIVIPHILPPDYAQYIAGNSLLGMPAFWLHGKVGTIDYAPVSWAGVADLFGGESGNWIQLTHDGYGAYSGTSAVGGDSGDPGFLSLSNNPILLFALDLSSDAGGMFASGPLNWYWLEALGLTNGLNILDISGYPLQSAATPTPDYNYIVPPTNQLASVGTLVTFNVSVCVFNTSPFAYQWQWNGANLAGATNAVLTFRAAPTKAGYYSVIVSNELGSVTVGATLTLTDNQLAQILAPVVANGQFQFGFNTISNYTYNVQYEDNLASGNWVVLTNITGAGSYWQTPPMPLVMQRFYRFVASPP